MNSLYCFSPEGISIFDADSRKNIKIIEEPGHGWSDGLVSLDQKSIFINDPRGSQVIVLNIDKNEIISTLPVGKAPIRMYMTLDGNEI